MQHENKAQHSLIYPLLLPWHNAFKRMFNLDNSQKNLVSSYFKIRHYTDLKFLPLAK